MFLILGCNRSILNIVRECLDEKINSSYQTEKNGKVVEKNIAVGKPECFHSNSQFLIDQVRKVGFLKRPENKIKTSKRCDFFR